MDKRGADPARITGITPTPLRTANTPIIPEPGLPEPVNRTTRLTANHAHTAPVAAKVRVVKTEALLDSGSLAGDFINRETLRTLGGTHHLRSAEETIIVCSGLDNKCIESNVVLDVTIEFDVGDTIHKINIPVRMSNE